MINRLEIAGLWQIAALLLTCASIIFYGRIDIATGIYCSVMSWAYNVDVGPTTLLWIAVGTLISSGIVRYLRRADLRPWLRAHDLGLIILMSLWSFWMLVSYVAFPTPLASTLFNNTVLYNLFSFFLIFFFARDESSIKSMVYGFIAASAVSGFIALQMLTDPVQYLLEDPDFRFRGLSGINYLTFAVPFALSCIFALVRVLVARHTAEKIVMGLVTIFLMFCLVLTGARQSVLGMAIALLIIVTWALQTKRLSLWLLLLIVGASISMAWVLYTSTALSDRWAAASGDYQIRTEYWVEAWHTFLRSPVWGSGFEYWQIGWAHNLLLDVLASQGVIGLAFLIGFLVFTLSAARGTWRVAGSAEIAAWRLGALAALVYTVVQTSFSGGLAGFPHFFWIPALIWRLGAMMHQDDKYQITPNVTSYEHLATEQVALHPR